MSDINKTTTEELIEKLKCSTCKEILSVDKFYKKTNITRGYQYDCKDCAQEKIKKLDPKRFADYKLKNLKKKQAQWSVKAAKKRGDLIKQPCVVCGSEKTEAHHESYEKEKWLDVVWYCRTHHRQRHKELKDMGIEL